MMSAQPRTLLPVSGPIADPLHFVQRERTFAILKREVLSWHEWHMHCLSFTILGKC